MVACTWWTVFWLSDLLPLNRAALVPGICAGSRVEKCRCISMNRPVAGGWQGMIYRDDSAAHQSLWTFLLHRHAISLLWFFRSPHISAAVHVCGRTCHRRATSVFRSTCGAMSARRPATPPGGTPPIDPPGSRDGTWPNPRRYRLWKLPVRENGWILLQPDP